MSERDDEPRLVGNVYCSPSCGRGCTIHEYEQAVQEAESMAYSLGKPFKPRVWENLGWHASADAELECGTFVSVYTGYHALIGSHQHAGWSQGCGDTKETPQQALRSAWQHLVDYLHNVPEDEEDEDNELMKLTVKEIGRYNDWTP